MTVLRKNTEVRLEKNYQIICFIEQKKKKENKLDFNFFILSNLIVTIVTIFTIFTIGTIFAKVTVVILVKMATIVTKVTIVTTVSVVTIVSIVTMHSCLFHCCYLVFVFKEVFT